MKQATMVIILTALLVAGCVSQPAADPAVETLAARFASTVTAQALNGSQASQDLEALQAQATATLAAYQATQEAAAALDSDALKATQEAAGPILAELPLYDVDPVGGHVGWIHDPAVIQLDGYQQFGYKNDYAMMTTRDFVIASDIRWDTQYGTAGCGYVLRANGDTEKPSEYVIAIMRGPSGYIYFAAQYEGELVNYDALYAIDSLNTKDQYQWEPDSTNRLAVVARGNQFFIYLNNALLGMFDAQKQPDEVYLPPLPDKPQVNLNRFDQNTKDVLRDKYSAMMEEYNQLERVVKEKYNQSIDNFDKDKMVEEGFVGLFGFAEAGEATCEFSNTWLWMMDEPAP